MSNGIYIEPFKKVELFSIGEINFVVDIRDDYESTTLFVAEKDIPDDLLKLLEKVIEWKNQPEVHGRSCDTIQSILDNCRGSKRGITLGDKFYDYAEIEHILKYDYRNLYECPTCGYQSFDDDCGECATCHVELQFVQKEQYEV